MHETSNFMCRKLGGNYTLISTTPILHYVPIQNFIFPPVRSTWRNKISCYPLFALQMTTRCICLLESCYQNLQVLFYCISHLRTKPVTILQAECAKLAWVGDYRTLPQFISTVQTTCTSVNTNNPLRDYTYIYKPSPSRASTPLRTPEDSGHTSCAQINHNSLCMHTT